MLIFTLANYAYPIASLFLSRFISFFLAYSCSHSHFQLLFTKRAQYYPDAISNAILLSTSASFASADVNVGGHSTTYSCCCCCCSSGYCYHSAISSLTAVIYVISLYHTHKQIEKSYFRLKLSHTLCDTFQMLLALLMISVS